MTDPADHPTASGSARRLLLLVIVALLALVFVAAFGGQLGRMQPGLGDPQIILGEPTPAAASPS